VEFRFSDRLRPGAAQAVADLQAKGLRVLLLSGDTAPAAAAVALQLGITEATGNCLPDDKAARIAEMTQAGARVLMVGDGLNDTAALTAAHVSISPASALDAARVASDIVFLGQDLSPLGDALVTSRKSIKRIRENFTISTIYNVLAVPLAIAGFATPLIAALAMSTSSITVGLNSIRLR
jgi:Cu2+-exporting ATPase